MHNNRFIKQLHCTEVHKVARQSILLLMSQCVGDANVSVMQAVSVTHWPAGQ